MGSKPGATGAAEAAATSAATSRVASHAGSWYEAKGATLAKQLTGWLDAVPAFNFTGPVRAVIAPHAGYSYSGPTAAYSYKAINPQTTKRIVILGPSHHHYTKICELSAHATYGTPIGDIKLDTAMIAGLKAAHPSLFGWMAEQTDEDEHSIEMQLPYLAHVMKGQNWSLVPILVGALTTAKEQEFGKALAPYLDDPNTVFVMSSDFCHWGKRFQFTPYDKSKGQRWQSIEALDRQGMELIAAQDAAGFAAYQAQTQNTICGRHPIAVYLNALQHCKAKHRVQFLHYTQSNHCVNPEDSSVSYAAAAVTLAPADTAAGTTAAATAAAAAGSGAPAAAAGAKRGAAAGAAGAAPTAKAK